MSASVRHQPIDRVISLEPGQRALTLRFIPWSDPIFDEHFPEFPVLPGSFVLATAFASAALLFGDASWSVRAVARANFRRAAGPGDALATNVERVAGDGERHDFRFTCAGYHDTRPLANGAFTLSIGRVA